MLSVIVICVCPQSILACIGADCSVQYFIGTQLVSFILIAPWLSTTHTYDTVFDSQFRLVNKSWYVYRFLKLPYSADSSAGSRSCEYQVTPRDKRQVLSVL